MKTFEPILMRDPLPCDRCGEPTLWRTPRQSKTGRCLAHIRGLDRPLTAAGDRLARRIVFAAFPEASVSAAEPPTVYRRGEYPRWVLHRAYGAFIGSGARSWWQAWGLPPDCGPCRDCGALIRLYGPDGFPLCRECLDERNRS